MRDVIVGFFGFRPSPLVFAVGAADAPFAAAAWEEAGSAKKPSGWLCNEDAVEADATGDTAGFAAAAWGLVLAGAAISAKVVGSAGNLELEEIAW
jgi:hypothetical protein